MTLLCTMVDTNLVPLRSHKTHSFPIPSGVGCGHITFKNHLEKVLTPANPEVLVDGTEWALRHLQELKTPLLVLHGVEDELVLVSGSRWFNIPIKSQRTSSKAVQKIPGSLLKGQEAGTRGW